MSNTYNIYCDESCHLESDNSDIMVLGGISCSIQFVKKINEEIRQIKVDNGIKKDVEIKWTKVSASKIELYKQLIDLFFDKEYLSFRGVIISGKSELNHEVFCQDHDTWYYKMYYYLLREMIRIGNTYRIYVDIKDTKSSNKITFLQKVLNNSLYDFYNETVERIQTVRSEEIELLQLTDLIIGALSYKNRNLTSSDPKLELIEYIASKSGTDLTHTTKRFTEKFNIFVWKPRR